MLPDEIVSEILSPALRVPEELFSDTSSISPFSNYAPSTSAYLLVCKDWLRVGTSLLYNVVILRSKAQANALETVLRANPEFGRLIKKLRVEGGYGSAMYTILKSAPKITDLFVSLAIWSPDTASGLCKGLPLIDPHRFIVVDSHGPESPTNKQSDALRKIVMGCIRSWQNLRIFGYPYGHVGGILRQRALELSETLVESQVHTVVLGSCIEYRVPPSIINLCNIRSLKVLQFPQPSATYRSHDVLLSHINGIPELKKVVKLSRPSYQEKPMAFTQSNIPSSANLCFVPMESVSEEIREIVWKRVLFFAMYVEELRSPSFSRSPGESHPSRLPILGVSRYFHRLALPYLYECVEITTCNYLEIKRRIREQPQLGSFIRRIFAGSLNPRQVADVVLAVVPHTHHLEIFAGPMNKYRHGGISMAALGLLGKTAGHSILKLSIFLESEQRPISVSLFEPFTLLRVLEIRGYILRAEVQDIHPDALSALDTLRLHIDVSGPLLRLFARMRLDSLRTVGLPESITDESALTQFFDAHGRKLLHLTIDSADHFPILDTCPNLLEIEIRRDCCFKDFTPDSPHISLTKIIGRSLPKNREGLDFHADRFPAMREIQIRELQWPTTERDILKSKVVPFAESLLEKNIKLTDSEGKQWRPRLKFGRGRRV